MILNAPNPTITFVGNTFNGEPVAYIYVIFSREYRFAYVGQTNQKNGTIGRLKDHISSNGTLRVRFEEKYGIELELVNDLTLFSFCLGYEKIFTSLETTFREGVEYLVQKNLYFISAKNEKSFKLISNIRTNSTATLGKMNEIAHNISYAFHAAYSG